MPGLNCNAEKCRHNYEHKCTRNTIQVGDCFVSGTRQVECKSYKDGKCVMDNEFANDIILNTCDLKKTNIDCDTMDCVYNHNRVCKVEHVEIREALTDKPCVKAECTTYKSK